jgi:type I restriction enzyme S subunit
MGTHKQGLIQQLFPQEGETVPRLRFPEFRDAGKWAEKRLGDLGQLVSGLTYSPTDVRERGLLVLRSSNIQSGEINLDDRVYVRGDVNGVNLSRPDDIVICVRNGSKSLIGKNAIVPQGMPVCTHGAFMTVFRAAAPHFVHVLLQTKAYRKQVAADLGATINSINGSQLLKYRFIVPKPTEQMRIAACVFSLDEVLAAQLRKVKSLKAQKRGLMQQLFPTLEAR